MQNMQNMKKLQELRNMQNIQSYKEPSYTEYFFIKNTNQLPDEEKLSMVSGLVSTYLYDSKSIYKAIIDLRSKYPQGMRWTNDEYYVWTKEVELKQQQGGWQGAADEIGGVDISGVAVGPNKKVTVTYTQSTDTVTFPGCLI